MRSPERTGWMPVVSARARAATLRMAAGSVSSELEVEDSISSESSPSRLSREPSSSAARAGDSAWTARATRHRSSWESARTTTRSLPVAAPAASASRSSASGSEPSWSSPRAARLTLSSSSSSRSYATPRTNPLCAFAPRKRGAEMPGALTSFDHRVPSPASATCGRPAPRPSRGRTRAGVRTGKTARA